MIFSLLGLAVPLQAIAIPLEKLSHFGVTDGVVPGRQFRRQGTGTLASPTQGGLRVAARGWLEQTVQGRNQTGIVACQRVSSPAFPTDPARRPRRRLQFLDSLSQRHARQAARAAHT